MAHRRRILESMNVQGEVIDWLLEGDSAIRWQVHRDLVDSDETVWRAEQAEIAMTGWGAQLLAERNENGKWANGLYGPKWTSTTYTLLQLWRMGLSRDNDAARESTQLLMDKPVWIFGSAAKPYWEACVAGFGLSLSSWFGLATKKREDLVSEVLAAQLADGGWNCRSPRGAIHSSFHTTINVLEGLREYCLAGGDLARRVEEAEARAREFFCEHHLYRSHRTGRIPDVRMTRLPFPPRWHHDVLRGLDYFRAANAPPDPRLADSISILLGHRRKDGKWPIHAGYPGQVWFQMESGRQPSRWNTLRALRVLRWFDGD